MHFNSFKFKTLQGRLIFFLLIPVLVLSFLGGVLSFIYTRNIMLNQWNESAVLKLQRAAHYIEDRILQPIELLEILFQNSNTERTALFPVRIAGFLEAMEGVVQVDFVGSPEKGYHPYADHSPMDQMNMKRENRMGLYRSRISSISDPDYKTGDVHETVIMTVSLSGPGGEDMGKLDIQMRFDYLLKDILQLGWWQSDLACIVDQKGKYMAHTNMIMNKRKFLGDKNDSLERAILEKMKQEPFGTVNSREHPPKKIAGFYKLEQVPWTIILFAQGDKIFQPIVNYRNAVALGSFVLVLLILILIRLHVGRMVTYIKLLSDKAQKVAKGEYGTPIPVDSEDEIGQLIHCHNTMVAGLAERDFIRNSFGRYVDPEFAKILLNHPDAGKLGGERREVVIMMSDIRGFTALSETLSPEIIISILNQYFSIMIEAIQNHNGIIVDFVGDSILAFFEPLSDSMADTVSRCIQCSSQMQARMSGFNKDMQERALPDLAMGIGINAGQVIVGNIGSSTRAKYGIVGSAVNITSRIQAMAGKQEIVISEAVHPYLDTRVHIKNSFSADLKGVNQPMPLHVIQYNPPPA